MSRGGSRKSRRGRRSPGSRSSPRWAPCTSRCAERAGRARRAASTSQTSSAVRRVKLRGLPSEAALAAALGRRAGRHRPPTARRRPRPADRPDAAGALRRARSAARAKSASIGRRCAPSTSTSSSGWAAATPAATAPSWTSGCFDHVNLRADRIEFLDGARRISSAECERYERRHRRGGRHRPADSRDRRQRSHRLQRAGRRAGRAHARRDARRADARRQRAVVRRRPRRACRAQALTMGMATILRARSIVLIATGEAKSGRRARDARGWRDDARARVVPAAAPAGDGDARRMVADDSGCRALSRR